MSPVSDVKPFQTAEPVKEKSRYRTYLRRALQALFRPVEQTGFWDQEGGRIIRALNYQADESGRLFWQPDYAVEWRYAPFAAMGVMRWRTSPVGDDAYDENIRAQLSYFQNHCRSPQIMDQIPSYGLGPLTVAFSLAGDLFWDTECWETARLLHKHSATRYHFENSEDSLLLYGWCFLHRYEENAGLRGDIEKAADSILARQDKSGLFLFGNSTTRNFQNQMYALWALGEAADVLSDRACLPRMEMALNAVVKRHMLKNGAFLWDSPPLLRRLRSRLIERVNGRTPAWRFLFACHQTFFVNAVCHYERAGGDRDYGREVSRAMDWLFGGNVLERDLVEISGLGVPLRVMTPEGNLFLNGQQFIGTYEVGSYIMALTELLTTGDPAGKECP